MTDDTASTTTNATSVPEKKGTEVDVIVAFAAWASILLCLVIVTLYAPVPAPGDRLMLLLAGTGGGTLGWSAGIVLTPYSDFEGKTFAGLGKAVYGLITGYVVAKTDPLVTQFMQDVGKNGVPTLAGMEAAIALITFVGATTVTFISRRYWVKPLSSGNAKPAEGAAIKDLGTTPPAP